MNGFESPYGRVVDLIANLERVSPTMPVEIWTSVLRGRFRVIDVVQMTPILMEQMRMDDFREHKSDPFPVVVMVEAIPTDEA